MRWGKGQRYNTCGDEALGERHGHHMRKRKSPVPARYVDSHSLTLVADVNEVEIGEGETGF